MWRASSVRLKGSCPLRLRPPDMSGEMRTRIARSQTLRQSIKKPSCERESRAAFLFADGQRICLEIERQLMYHNMPK